ncbi:MAG: hypothetical protein BGP06_19860 [Rhizobiales bacterium 65-9]|nr:EthD domain-containing protein [Hyphomicrobiales bacterium]OJY37104.1 MAG: hypothetical protein BGP06_19860 [Rhizobiales bacterium 65-9]
MIKVIGLIKRRPDMTRQQFKDYWLNEHSKLERASLQKNPVQRIVVNFVEDNLVDEAPFDGMVEIYYASIEDMRHQWSSGHDGTMKADEANFCDPNFRIFFLAEEVEIGRKPIP